MVAHQTAHAIYTESVPGSIAAASTDAYGTLMNKSTRPKLLKIKKKSINFPPKKSKIKAFEFFVVFTVTMSVFYSFPFLIKFF